MTNIYSIITEQDYSNLTAAIEEGQPIDWERLDERTAKCVNRELNGSLTYMMERNPAAPVYIWEGWEIGGKDNLWTEMFSFSWRGLGGWTLWIEGEVPLIRKTADQLKVGTYFLGKARNDSSCLAYVGRPLKTNAVKTIYYAPDMLKAITPASEWVVLEEYGPFLKPEGK